MKLLVIGDMHFPSFAPENVDAIALRDAFYNPFFEALAEEKADCALFLGDISNEGTLDEIKSLAQKAKKVAPQCAIAEGNHDTHACTSAQFFEAIGQNRLCRIQTPLVDIAVLDTCMESCLTDWRGLMDGEQRDWLENLVCSSGDKPFWIAAHHPVADTTRRSDEVRLQIEPQARLREILSLKTEGVFINGHNHYHSIVEQDGWLFVQTGDLPSHTDYRVFEYDGKNLAVTTKSLADRMKGAKQLAEKMQRYTLYTDLRYPRSELEWRGQKGGALKR